MGRRRRCSTGRIGCRQSGVSTRDEYVSNPSPSWNDTAAESAILDFSARETGEDHGIADVITANDWNAMFRET